MRSAAAAKRTLQGRRAAPCPRSGPVEGVWGNREVPPAINQLVNPRERTPVLRRVDASLLPVPPPQEESQRSESGRREIGREGHPPSLLPADHGRAAPE